MKPLCITCQPEDLDQGLFGQVLYYVFQVLPYLHERGLRPQWEIRAKHYGDPPEFIAIPGVLDLAYTPPPGPYRRMELNELRRRHSHVLGHDWQALHALWTSFFAVPPRVLAAAATHMPAGRILGVHYRGTDKQSAAWDTNPISQPEYLLLVKELLETRAGDFDAIFAATDEFSFVEELRRNTHLPVTTLGPVEFHLAEQHSTTRAEKSDRAMLDCVLLSRCRCVLETSSGLPSFAKLFNPDLEIYRTAASRLFSNMPYFPVAFIPELPVASAEARAILDRTMADDWVGAPGVQQFRTPFLAQPRWPRNHRLFTALDRFGLSDIVARFANGYR